MTVVLPSLDLNVILIEFVGEHGISEEFLLYLMTPKIKLLFCASR